MELPEHTHKPQASGSSLCGSVGHRVRVHDLDLCACLCVSVLIAVHDDLFIFLSVCVRV